MSFEAVSWAIKDAPVSDQTVKIVLIILAEPADPDGCGAFLSKKTIAKYALVDPKTVQRKLADLKAQGIIREGDQTRAAYIPEHRRPVVYDIQIPHSWYGSRIDRINADREDAGLEPLTPESRPDLPDAPERPARRDKGTRRDQDVTTKGDSTGGLEAGGDLKSPGDSESRMGGLEVPAGGDLKSPEPVKETSERTSPPLRGGERAPARTGARPRVEEVQGELPVGDTAPVADQTQTKIVTGALPDLGKRPRRSRKSVWPGLWEPSGEHVAWALAHYPSVDVVVETRAFNAYWDAPERRQAERDWAACWRTWVKRAAADGRSHRGVLPPSAAELEVVRPLGDRWWGWCLEHRRVFGERREVLDARLVEFVRAGASLEELARALWVCQEPVPPSYRVAKALRGEIAPPNGNGQRRSTTDERVAQVDDAVAAAQADLAAWRDRRSERAALGGGGS